MGEGVGGGKGRRKWLTGGRAEGGMGGTEGKDREDEGRASSGKEKRERENNKKGNTGYARGKGKSISTMVS